MSAPFFSGKTVLVTGGSSGIGFELARLFLADGAEVILTASRSDTLEKAADSLASEFGSRPRTVVADLSDPASPKKIFAAAAGGGKFVDVLVNNAGFGLYGKFPYDSLDKTLAMVDVNVRALVELTGLFLPGMRARNWGRILNVSSTAAFQPIPIESAYAASKAFVLFFSEGLSEELEGSGVTATCLCPGPTKTAFFEKGTIFPSKMLKRSMMDGASVARIGFDALKKGKPLAIAGLRNSAGTLGARLLPRQWIAKIARRVVE